MHFTASTVFLAAAFLQTGLVTAANEVTTWKNSQFIVCVQKTYPNFPKEVVRDPKVFLACGKEGKGKRNELETRDFDGWRPTDILNELKQSLTVSKRGDCDKKPNSIDNADLPKNFMIVTDMRAVAHEFCTDPTYKKDLITYGTVTIDRIFHTAVHKKAAEIFGGKTVGFKLILSLTPGVSQAYAAYTEIQDMVAGACEVAFTNLNTKDTGCTDDIGWYNVSKAKRGQSTGAISGIIQVISGASQVMEIAQNFMDPEDM